VGPGRRNPQPGSRAAPPLRNKPGRRPGYTDIPLDETRVANAVALLLEGATPMPDGRWRAHRGCIGVDPNIFTHDPPEPELTLTARRFCDACDVRVSCMLTGIATKEVGIWGGMTEPERRRASLLVRRAQAKGEDICAHCIPNEDGDGCLCGCDAYGNWCGCAGCRTSHFGDEMPFIAEEAS